MRNDQTRCDLCVRLIITFLGKFNGYVIMLVFDVAIQKFSSEHNLLNKTLAQAAIRVSDDSPHLLFKNKNQFMELYSLNEWDIKIL